MRIAAQFQTIFRESSAVVMPPESSEVKAKRKLHLPRRPGRRDTSCVDIRRQGRVSRVAPLRMVECVEQIRPKLETRRFVREAERRRFGEGHVPVIETGILVDSER